MIDTVRIRLNNLVKHKHIYNYSIANDDVIKTKPITERTAKVSKTAPFGSLLERNVIHYQKSQSAVETLRIHNRYNPSSHYSIMAYVNPVKDCIVYEFSIPKYFYGTNIIMACQNPTERDFIFSRGYTDTLKFNRDNFYPRLITYIKAFFTNEYPGLKVDYTDVEILQIDLCWNQVFNSKRDALAYLELQKNIKKNYLRPQTSRFYMNYETSIFYGGTGYKAEIYHKGTEYAKNDRKKHEKYNREREKKHKKPLFDVEYFQSLSDRMLRYEVAIRPEKMSYIFHEKVFRKNSKSYQVMKEIFNSLRSKSDANRLNDYSDVEDIIKKYRNTFINSSALNCIDYICNYFRDSRRGYDEVLSDHEYFNLLCKFMRNFDRMTNKIVKFYMDLTDEEYSFAKTDRTSNVSMMESYEYHVFDKEIFQACFDFFVDFINEYRVEKRDSINIYVEKVEQYNAEIDKKNEINKILKRPKKPKLDKNRMFMLIATLESYTDDQFRKMADVNDRTWRRYKADLKKIGITKNTLNEAQPIKAVYDLSSYYLELLTHIGRWNITNTSQKLF